MPVVQLPISKGLVVDSAEADWLDGLPVNMVAVPKSVLSAQGYMRSWPGLQQFQLVPNVGRGAVFNVALNRSFRVHGTSLIDGETAEVLGDVGGFGLAQLPFSSNSQAIVSDGRLQYYRSDQDDITSLQNWAEDERSNSWVPDFNNSYISIPVLNPAGDVTIEVTVQLEQQTGNQIILEDSTEATGTRLFITTNGAVGFSPNEASTADTTGNSVFTFDEIQRIRLVYDDSEDEAEVFINNTSQGTLTGFTGSFDQLDTIGTRKDTEQPRGAIYNVRITDVSSTNNSRFYPMIVTSEIRPDDETVDTDPVEDAHQGTLVNFPNALEWIRGVFTPTAPTDFDLSNIIDAVRNRGRYIWITQDSGTFGVTDLQNEQRPDYIAPFYSAEAEPDRNVAVDAWKGYVVIFGRFTVEYFGLTGSSENIYSPAQSLTVRVGIIGRGCKCHYIDSFAILGSSQFEPPSIYIIQQGSYQEIATRRIQKILRSYTEQEIADSAYMEPVKFDAHEFLMIHLPDDVLVYDFNASQASGGPQWAILKSDINGNRPYRGIYHIYDGDQWTAGDKRTGVISRLTFTDARHLGEEVEFMVETPMVQARNARLYDLEIDNVPGYSGEFHRLAYSVTFDGNSYGQENWIHLDEPLNYRERILARRLGYSRNNIGFRLRWTTDSPSAISNFRVRVE